MQILRAAISLESYSLQSQFLPKLFHLAANIRMCSWHSFGSGSLFRRSFRNLRPQDSVVYVAKVKQEIKEGGQCSY